MYVHERDNICSIVLEKNSKNENIKVRSEYVDSSSKPNMETFIGFIPTIHTQFSVSHIYRANQLLVELNCVQ